ncbi:EF hand [Necator americanus]|uniref:EF hand n=1 Tax=Necator americanus TaxID=51031 RepID=W2TCY6_NECAM|nr:EF hand [Necator americanus]ETN79698.1 EF hand [Necator americanus]
MTYCVFDYARRKGNGCIEIDEFLQALRKQLLSPREERELREVFGVFDKDGDGLISTQDLKSVMLSLGETLSEDAAREMIKEGDVDHDGMINFHGKNKPLLLERWYVIAKLVYLLTIK